MKRRRNIVGIGLVVFLALCATKLQLDGRSTCGDFKGALRVSWDNRRVQKQPVVYPELAKRARVEGEVILRVLVARDGSVKRICLISGHPLLVDAAMDSVKQWRYEPFLLNGKRFETEVPAVVRFALSK